MFGELVCWTMGAFGLTHFDCELRRLRGTWACQTDSLEVAAFIMNTGNSFTLGPTTMELYLSFSHIHTDIFPFAFHLYRGQSPPQCAGSVNVPTNRQRAGVPWKQVVALRDVVLKKKGDKFEQSIDSGFSMLGFPPLCLMDPAKKLQKVEEKLGLLPLPKFL